MQPTPETPLEHAVRGKVIYLLALIIFLQFGYPLSAYGSLSLILTQVLYVLMIGVGVLIGRDNRGHTIALAVTGFAFLACGILYALNPQSKWAEFATYLTLTPYLFLVAWLLGRFLIFAKTITRDVIYAAISLYLLIGALFVPIYGLIEALIPLSFRDGSFPDAPIQWQQFVYYSYTTLTSTGYGDILPLSWWARAAANFEMVLGVMFITIVMSRLVALYTSEK